ncbi:MAG: hypothetical protein AAEJ52_21290 [Myxococcota bacterium]
MTRPATGWETRMALRSGLAVGAARDHPGVECRARQQISTATR